MQELDYIRSALHDRRVSIVASETGLSVPTVRAIRNGDNQNPTLETLKALSDYLQAKP